MILILFLTCIYVSYTDLRYKKVRNLCTFGLIIIGTVSQLLFLSYGEITTDRFIELFFGGFITVYLMHFASIWSPGDSKLFWGILMMSPPSLFSEAATTHSPILALVINIFVPYFFYTTIYLLIKSSTQQKRVTFHKIQNLLKPKKALQHLFDCTCFMGFGSLVFMFFDKIGYHNGFLKIIILLSFFSIFSKLTQIYRLDRFKRYLLFSLSLVLLFVTATRSLKMLVLLFVLLFIKLFFRLVTRELGSHLFIKQVDLFSLQEGMISAERIIKEEKENGKIIYSSKPAIFAQPLKEEVLLDVTVLSTQKIEQLQQLALAGVFCPPGNKIKIQQETVFAPIISLGAVMTIIFKGPFYQAFS